MGSITNTGYEPVALADWISRFETLFRRVYGSDIDLSAKSADGQMVGILAQMFADQDEQVATCFAMLDPNQASGTWVDQFLAYLALRRKSAQTTQRLSLTFLSLTDVALLMFLFFVASP